LIYSRSLARLTVPALLLACLAGCAGSPTFPPVTTADAAVPRPGKFVWHDLLTEDVAAAKRFYGELLGWTYEPTESDKYSLILHRGRPIGGMVDMTQVRPESNESQWVSVLSVADVDAAARLTEEAGGEIHLKPVDLPGRGRLAIVTDPQGAVVAYLRAVSGDPPDSDHVDPGRWMWTELWSHDIAASKEFYGKLVGYELDSKTILEDIEYTFFAKGGVPRAGIIENPIKEVRSNWLPYVRVDDPAAMAERVAELGGQVILAPSEEARDNTVAVVTDPSGAAVALQKWLRDEEAE